MRSTRESIYRNSRSSNDSSNRALVLQLSKSMPNNRCTQLHRISCNIRLRAMTLGQATRAMTAFDRCPALTRCNRCSRCTPQWLFARLLAMGHSTRRRTNRAAAFSLVMSPRLVFLQVGSAFFLNFAVLQLDAFKQMNYWLLSFVFLCVIGGECSASNCCESVRSSCMLIVQVVCA